MKNPGSNPINLVWSYSRSVLLRSCPRAFYFEQAEPENASRIPRSQPLRSIVGSAVHEAIALEIGAWASGRPVSLQRAEKNAAEKIEEAWFRKEDRITEAMNGMQVSDGLYERLDRAARSRLRTFFRMLWPHFSGQTYVMHERLDSFDLEGIRIRVQVDLATRSKGGEFVISDWKTGMELDPELTDLQMGIYALWASAGMGERLDEVITQVVNLRTGQLARRSPDTDLLARVGSQLGIEAQETAPPLRKDFFKPLPALEKCLACRFLRRCPEGGREVSRYQTPLDTTL